MTEIAYKAKCGQVRFTATLHGQHICELKLGGTKDIGYGQDVTGGNIDTLDDLKTLMTHLSSAIAEAAAKPVNGLKIFDTVFSFPSCAAIGKYGPISQLDAFLEGMQLVVFDAQHWVQPDFQFKCTRILDAGTDRQRVCSQPLTNFKGWSDATSSKGYGQVQWIWMASRVRFCSKSACNPFGCGAKSAEHTMLDQLPREVRSLIPVFRTERSGVVAHMTHLLSALIPAGVPFMQIERAMECITQTIHAEQVCIHNGACNFLTLSN